MPRVVDLVDINGDVQHAGERRADELPQGLPRTVIPMGRTGGQAEPGTMMLAGATVRR